MSPATTRQISREEFTRLLQHASQQVDFVHVGTVGEGAGRGTWRGFSCGAAETHVLQPGKADSQTLVQLAGEMESQTARYTERADNPECLVGGWIGFLSYELGYIREPRLAPICPTVPVPLFSAGLYLWMASHNRQTDDYYLWIHPECPQSLIEQITGWLSEADCQELCSWKITEPFKARQSPESFKASVQAIRDYIQAGDCYQTNLSQEFVAKFRGNPWCAFQALAAENPTPYGAFIRAGEYSVLSISPERFLEIEGRTVKTSPIKGTRPRGRTTAEDAALADELQASEKDRAENLMIVDLLRNDLSLNAATGSVSVDELFALESYRNVHHLVSHIRAELADGVSPLKALFDAFPGGSITGAPKIRAMEIIRELEPHWRGPYCGSVFYYGLDGRLDSNIAIRTLLCDGEGTIRCWGGGGIVADSDPEAEYQETLAKVGSLMGFLEELEVGEE
ncbi:aminodeoxychorismate synthase component I [Marinobacter pelagius]|uniref:aminodeoxychorismate synthase component I n=1 Tax=Marinobacter sp. C7 TaxID=2951363 RepID=UPI001EF014D3|nr:aminodeoxychorismate synthase component I [Marinobacter sp. C7]MCG7199524.1 aminodeoxychorismate synthase component I [Marinobacter sp. C7]